MNTHTSSTGLQSPGLQTSERIRKSLANFRPDPSSPHSELVQKALYLARSLQERAAQLQTSAERRQQAELDRMLQSPTDKYTLTQITDQAFRARDPNRAVDHLVHILDMQGIPRFFSLWDQALLKGFQSFGGYAPGVALPLVKEGMRKETANVILPGEKEMLAEHLSERTRQGVRMNVNSLGEAILGEDEAEERLKEYLQMLQWPEIEVVSIKISTLYSQISPIAREHTVAVLCDRMERLFRTAAHMKFRRTDGSVVSKFVYLDMEEYRDLDLTAEAFMKTLDRRGLENVRAGIALQAYIPDSFGVLQSILKWARTRVAQGGSRIGVRLVKGANMEMERVEASLRGWPQAPYKTKLETDANYRRMLHEVLHPENIAVTELGVASHNLFELAYAVILSAESNALDAVHFEMLEGMANHQRRALFELTHELLLYAPACKRENFINAIGYLVRRLDENTGPDNFLRHAFRIKVDSPEWKRLESGFLDALAQMPTVSELPRRTQNRLSESPDHPAAIAGGWQQLVNEPDTDFALRRNGEWAEQIVAKWKPLHGDQAVQVPLVINGQDIWNDRDIRDCLDPSRPGFVVGRYRQATDSDILDAVACAHEDRDGWRSRSAQDRFDVLGQVARELRIARADLIGAAIADGGKTIPESDPEVSEAIDFLEFYRDTARWWASMPGLRADPLGVVVVVSPWNFPIAIPCGGIAAALAAGNTVILKPASDTVLVAWVMCQCFWKAGVPKTALQFVPCSGGKQGRKLVNHPQVAAVVLTGGTETALTMLRDNPRMNLYAETGGKNATIVTALSDREQAIKHVIQSAFGHSGQKCSATSLLLLEDEVYDDPQFRHTLKDATQSMKTGSAWDLDSKVGPLIRPPSGDLDNALKVLDAGEEWLVTPEPDESNPGLWSPGIKYGVVPGSYTHNTEFFGPVLGVMKFSRLRDAVAWVNQTGYGLTSGLQSLDEREWEFWKENLNAGNLYLNRGTTGAIVLRQPFGGFGKSVFGPGMKAGGPNYVAQFFSFSDNLPVGHNPGSFTQPENEPLRIFCSEFALQASAAGISTDVARQIIACIVSYEQSHCQEFAAVHDHFRLPGQDNLRRYLAFDDLRIRVSEEDSPLDIFSRVAAANIAGCRVVVSIPHDYSTPVLQLLEELTEPWGAAIEFLEESDDELIAAIQAQQTDRIRYAHPKRVPESVLRAAAESSVSVISVPVVMIGRLELLWYHQEQSICIDYHRYGNLAHRGSEERAEPL